MLVKFKVENYRSFGTEQALDMTAGPVRLHPGHTVDMGGFRLLTLALVFGANASGKSNLVRAMQEAQRMILTGAGIRGDRYCRVLEGASSRTTGFEFTFETGGTVYSYGFEVMLSDGRVRTEWLNILSDDGARQVFSREGDDISTGFALDKGDDDVLRVYGNEVRRSGTLMLRALARADCSDDGALAHVGRAMGWFRDGLVILFPESRRTKETGSDIGFLGRMLGSYGTGVTGMGFERVDEDSMRIDGDLKGLGPGAVLNLRSNTDLYRIRATGDGYEADRVVFLHGDHRFSFEEESSGTRRLFDLSPLLDPDSGNDITYVVDEMDANLHPQLTRRFVRDFLAVAAGLRRQLVATVHESRLMDLGLVRRDELWLIQKMSRGSDLYSLEDFGERSDRRVDRAYLDGRYGGVPRFEELFPDLEDADEAD